MLRRPATTGQVISAKIRPVGLRDSGEYTDHLIAHMAESGKDGAPLFGPGRSSSREEIRDQAQLRWTRKLSEPVWGRAWAVVVEGRGIVGHIELRGGRIPAEMHRISVGMGLLQAFTGRGYGGQLMDVALAWAVAETNAEWVDLGVFLNNTPALKLYERKGFVRCFVREDAFRLPDGTRVDDVFMTRKLR